MDKAFGEILPVRDIGKDKIYRRHLQTGYLYRRWAVSFLPEFFDAFLNSRHGISPDEIVRAIDAPGTFPLIPDAAVILKQLGNASFTGDVGDVWIEAKARELVAVILDRHRRLEAAAGPPLKEQDQLGITEAIRYAGEHFAGPLTLTALARQAGMSIRTFTTVFKTHTGLSAASYIRRIRMDQAMYLLGRMSSFVIKVSNSQNAQGIEAEIPEASGTEAEELERIARSPHSGDAPNINSKFGLLKNTSAPLGDIAGMVGCKHQSRFSTLFREQFGVMPSEFRKRE